MFDGSRWTNPVTLDGFTGRIRPCLMASPGESYRAWWFLPCKSCHPALAAPVGQIPLGRVRLMKPTAFTSASAIVISTNALWGKHLNNCGLRLRRAQSAQSPSPKAPGPFQLPEPKARKPKTISPNHQGKAQSSLAFSRRHFGGWQPRFQWGHIRQLPLHQAPEAYRPTPTQEPSRE